MTDDIHARRAALLADYERGLTLKVIAKRYGVRAEDVNILARWHGLPRRHLDVDAHTYVVERWIAGDRARDIARAVGRTPGRVRIIAKRFGLPPRPRSTTFRRKAAS